MYALYKWLVLGIKLAFGKKGRRKKKKKTTQCKRDSRISVAIQDKILGGFKILLKGLSVMVISSARPGKYLNNRKVS